MYVVVFLYLQKLKCKPLAHINFQGSSPAAKRHHPLVQGAYYEECDLTEEEDATFFVIAHTNVISQKVYTCRSVTHRPSSQGWAPECGF